MNRHKVGLNPGIKTLFAGLAISVLFAISVAVANPVVSYILLGVALLVAFVGMVLANAPFKKLALKLKDGASADEVLETAYAAGVGEAFGEVAEKAAADSRKAEVYVGASKALGNPMLIADPAGKIIHCTPAVLEMIGKPITQVIGFSVSKAFYNRDGASITEKAINSKRPIDDIVELELWNGKQVTVRIFAQVVFNEAGDVIGAVASFIDLQDVTEAKAKLEEQTRRMNDVGQEISTLAERVASASEELSASADEQARGAQKQNHQTDTVATAMEQMTATVLEVAQNASATSQAAEEARESAGSGVDMVSRAVGAINSVSESAGELSSVVSQLDSQAEEIGRIIGVINDIADQTNLLALNAAIEAARAGEAGRGFAVVADEVRKLAEKTVQATKEVEQAIHTIQDRSRSAMNSMSQTEERVNQSTELSNQAGQALQQIAERIEDMVYRVAQIATAAEEQSAAAEEINQSIEDIAAVAREADEGASQAASATRDLAELSQELLTVSMGFKGGESASRLRSSEGDMKGVLPKLAQGFISDTYGKPVLKHVQQELGDPVFLPTASYPDQVIHQMAELVGEKTGVKKREFFLGLGKYTIGGFYKLYKRYFKDESLKSFYLRMNDVHAQLTKDQPGIKPPKFTYEDKGNVLFMNYSSKRGLFDYFEGILIGAAEFKGEKVQVTVKPFDKETARAEIRFL